MTPSKIRGGERTRPIYIYTYEPLLNASPYYTPQSQANHTLADREKCMDMHYVTPVFIYIYLYIHTYIYICIDRETWKGGIGMTWDNQVLDK